MRVFYRRGNLCLSQEAFPELGVRRQFRSDHFQRYGSLRPRLGCAIDHSHPASPDKFLDPVTGKHDPGGKSEGLNGQSAPRMTTRSGKRSAVAESSSLSRPASHLMRKPHRPNKAESLAQPDPRALDNVFSRPLYIASRGIATRSAQPPA